MITLKDITKADNNTNKQIAIARAEMANMRKCMTPDKTDEFLAALDRALVALKSA